MSAVTLKVLVADDSSTIHALFRQMAQNSVIPFETIHAENGRECMELLNSGKAELAFIDIDMPEMTGMEALGAARYLGNRTFVTVMSGNVSDKRVKLARDLKAYEFLKKPFHPDEVQSILRTYCRVTAPTKALIVDDSGTVRRIVRKVLESSIFNIAVTEVGDGAKALAACMSGKFDVIFLDCNMPEIDGLETLQQIVRRDPDAHVIMMTSERNEDKRRWALGNGAATFLYKPFYASTVDQELHALFDLKWPGLGFQQQSDEQHASPAQALMSAINS
jgi:CheY-like chemotaxis protein